VGFSETLELLLHADASGGIAEVRKFASESGKSVSEVESNFKRLGASMMKIGGTGMAAGGFLTAIGDKERQASEGLKASIQAAGQSYDEFEGKVEHAVKGQENFGHSAVETNQALSTLVGSFGDTDQALDRMQLVADLAAKKHIGLADAAAIVAKAHGGAGRVFKEFNVQVQENADGTKNYDGALDELSKKVSGQASASVSGLSGQFQILATKAEDFVATLGQDYGPAILGLSTGLTALGGITSALGSGLTALKVRHVEAAAAADEQAAATEVAAAAEAQLATNSSAAVASLYEQEAVTKGLGKTMQFGLAAGIAAGAFALADFLAGLDDIKVNIDEFAAKSSTDLDKVAHSFTGLQQYTAFGKDSLKEYEDQLIAGDVPAAERFADALDRAGITTDDFRKRIDEKRAGDVAAAADQDTYTSAVDDAKTATDDATKAFKEEQTALKELTAARQHDLDLVNSTIGGELGLSNAQIATRSSIEEMTKALKDSTQTTDEHKKATNDAESAIMAEAQAAGELAAKQAEQAGITDTATASTQAQIKELYNVMATLDPSSPLRQFLGDYIYQLQSVPGSISTDFNVYVNTITSALTESANRLNPNIKQYADGGMIPGPRGKPQLAIVHGGEYVSTADEVANAGRGGGSSSPAMGGSVTIYMDNRGTRMTGEEIISVVHNHARSNTAPVLLKEWLAS
jgi:hypothetical protein